MSERKIRVLVGKPGLDGHDRGAKVVARALRDAGMEVIYTGIRRRPSKSPRPPCRRTSTAWGLSILSGAHNHLFPRIRELLDAHGMEDVLLFGGGIVPDADIPLLKQKGWMRFSPRARRWRTSSPMCAKRWPNAGKAPEGAASLRREGAVRILRAHERNEALFSGWKFLGAAG